MNIAWEEHESRLNEGDMQHRSILNVFLWSFGQIAAELPNELTHRTNLLFMILTQKKSYVVVIKKDHIKGTYCSLDKDNGLYIRMYKDYLIIGGNDTDTGCKCINNFKEVVCKKFNVNKKDIIYSWHYQDTTTIDGIPYIGYSDMFHKNHIIVTGFNLWGFTWAMASSEIVFKLIKGKKYFKLTRLNRWCINKNLFKNIYTSFKNLLTFRRPRCTHLGCALIYNKEEEVYECPCHGSIYDNGGEAVKGPAMDDLNKDKKLSHK